MTDPRAAYASTALVDPSGLSGAQRVIELAETLSPLAVADAMLALPIVAGANLVVLQPDDREGAVLVVKRGGATVGAFWLTAERATAAVARLSVLAGLDPMATQGSLAGAGNVARLRVRADSRSGDVLLSVGASAAGLDAEVRLLGSAGPEVGARASGALRRCTRCGALQPAQLTECDQDRAPLMDVMDDPRPGGTVGAYQILEHLGAGGMGVVYSGKHAFIDRPVAIKLMRRSVAESPMMVRRFLAEARAASRIRHPNVVEVTDYGLLADGHPYMVMERVEGVGLDQILTDRGPLEVPHALAIAREVARGLGAAHQGGIVHNDLKPSNIVILPSSDVAPALKIVDFGAASAVGRAAVTEQGDLIGTPAYMSPEQARGEPSDGRADLYALGLVLYEMISGAPPFAGTPDSLMRAQLFEQPDPLVSPRGLLPSAVSRLISRALAKDPDARHQSAAEMMAEIEQARAAAGRVGWRRWLPS